MRISRAVPPGRDGGGLKKRHPCTQQHQCQHRHADRTVQRDHLHGSAAGQELGEMRQQPVQQNEGRHLPPQCRKIATCCSGASPRNRSNRSQEQILSKNPSDPRAERWVSHGKENAGVSTPHHVLETCLEADRVGSYRPSACCAGCELQLQRIRDGLIGELASWMLSPFIRCGSWAQARCTPLLASAIVKGRVALLSAKVEVRATAPGMLATQ